MCFYTQTVGYVLNTKTFMHACNVKNEAGILFAGIFLFIIMLGWDGRVPRNQLMLVFIVDKLPS